MPDERIAIVTNGEVAARLLAEAAPGVPVLPWRDMLHDGPVPAGLTLPELSALRAAWLAGELGLDAEEVAASFRERDGRLAGLALGTEVVLCLEHDLYDQLQLLQVLDALAPRAAGELRVSLAQGDDHLGTQAPARLADLLRRRRPLGAGTLAAARDAWAAFREPTPGLLAGLAGAADAPGLPRLRPAVARLLEELPDASGLTRTERTALSILAEGGEETPAGLFARVGEREEARFLGDWPFLRRLEGLAAAPEPLVEGLQGRLPTAGDPAARRAWAGSRLRITGAGRAVLRGDRDRLADRPPDRWLGGTRLRPGNVWRWDAAARRLTRDPA